MTDPDIISQMCNDQDKEGDTPLMLYLKKNKPEDGHSQLGTVIAFGLRTDTTIKNKNGDYALLIAEKHGFSADIIKTIALISLFQFINQKNIDQVKAVCDKYPSLVSLSPSDLFDELKNKYPKLAIN
jgi:hypothetical protein